MKTCRKCNQTKPKGEFWAHPRGRDRLQPYCKDCMRDASRLSALKHRRSNLAAKAKRAQEYRRRPENRVKIAARRSIYWDKREGRLVPAPCLVCGTTVRVEAHHPNHNDRRNVIWMCKTHHIEFHAQERREGSVS